MHKFIYLLSGHIEDIRVSPLFKALTSNGYTWSSTFRGNKETAIKLLNFFRNKKRVKC